MGEAAAKPVDSDIDVRQPRQSRRRGELRGAPWSVLGAISAGGVLGALARYGLSSAFPHDPGTFDWATFWINVSGCLVIGALMVLITEAWEVHRLVRPFLGVGVLGGFTTFSTYIVDIQKDLSAHQARTALLYLVATLIAALLAAYLGVAGARRIVRPVGKERS